jgi:hypothetical protein
VLASTDIHARFSPFFMFNVKWANLVMSDDVNTTCNVLAIMIVLHE